MIFLIVIVAIVILLLLTMQLARRFDLGLICLLAANFYDFSFGTQSSQFGRVHLGPMDVVCFALIGAGVIRTMSQLQEKKTTRVVALIFLAIMGFSYIRGVFVNGFFAASNETRSYTPAIIGMLYFLTAPTDKESVERYVRYFFYFGGGLCVIAFLAFCGLPVGFKAWAHTDVLEQEGRFLTSDATIAIGICTFFALAWVRAMRRGLFYNLYPILFLTIAIYLRHRTVWIMIIAGFITTFLIDFKLVKKFLPAVALSAVAILLLAIYSSTSGEGASTTDLSNSATDTNTWEWRVNSWFAVVLDEEQTVVSVAIGKPLGSGFLRFMPESGTYVDIVPHSEYVTEYARVGVVGFVCEVIFFFLPLARLWKMSKARPFALYPSTSAWAIMVVMFIANGITYSLQQYSFAMLGIANALVAATDEDDWGKELAETEDAGLLLPAGAESE